MTNSFDELGNFIQIMRLLANFQKLDPLLCCKKTNYWENIT